MSKKPAPTPRQQRPATSTVERKRSESRLRTQLQKDLALEAQYDLAGPSFNEGVPPPVDETFNKRLSLMDRINAAEKPVVQTKPLYQWSAQERQSFNNLIGALGDVIHERTVRPEDPETLRELRRVEQQRHATSSSAWSATYYKPKTANPRYASQMPESGLNGITASGKKQILFGDNTARNAHVHMKEDTLILDARWKCGCDLFGRIPPQILNNSLFSYCTMPMSDRSQLRYIPQHRNFNLLSENLERQSFQGTFQSLKEMIADMRSSSGLSLHSVQFRYDEQTCDIVLNIDTDGTIFGVVSTVVLFDKDGDYEEVLESASTSTTAKPVERPKRPLNMASLHEIVQKELVEARKADGAKALQPAKTIGRLDEKTKVDMVTELEEMRKLNQLYFKPHRAISLSSDVTKVDRLVGRSTPFSVFDPEKSVTLGAIKVKFSHAYFAVCQCSIDERDIEQYKLKYALAARSFRQQTSSTSSSRRRDQSSGSIQPPPIYDSDDERVDRWKKGDKADIFAAPTPLTSEGGTTKSAEYNPKRPRDDRSTKERERPTTSQQIIGSVAISASVPFVSGTEDLKAKIAKKRNRDDNDDEDYDDKVIKK